MSKDFPGYDVYISGGKDSTVIADLVEKSGVNYRLFYNYSAIEPPASLPFIKKNYPNAIVLRRDLNFWQMLIKYGYPSANRRWCCYQLKERTHPEAMGRYKLLGVRAEEGWKRNRLNKIQRFKGGRRIFHVNPILDWKEWQVWEYIEKHNLPVHLDYDRGLSRIGCIVCPFICLRDRSKIDFHKTLYPKQYRMFEKIMAKVFINKIEEMSEFYSPEDLVETAEEFLDNWYRGSQVPYVKKSKMRKCLFAPNGKYPNQSLETDGQKDAHRSA